MKKPLLTTLLTLLALIPLFLIANFLILRNTAEHHRHNMNGAAGNKVYLHVDGHREAVYDADGKLVTDPANQASYNLCHPVEDPFCHFMQDTLPWIRWGSSPEDPTTKEQRWEAFWRDYWEGAKRMLQ